MTVAEALEVDEWLQSTLATDPTLTGLLAGGVHEDPAPTGTQTPYVVHTGYSTLNKRVRRARIWTELFRRVVVWHSPGDDYAAVKAAVVRIDELLDDVETTTSTIRLTSHQSQPARQVDPEPSTLRARGAWYRIWAHAL